MKKHSKKSEKELFEQLVREFKGLRGVRFLSLITHLYVEYYVNELLCNEFEHPEKVIDDKELGEFNNKLSLLKARGFFDDKAALLKNVELLSRIRNYYAHNLSSKGVPAAVSDRVRELKQLKEFKNQKRLFAPFLTGFKKEDAFRVKAIQTILVLAKSAR